MAKPSRSTEHQHKAPTHGDTIHEVEPGSVAAATHDGSASAIRDGDTPPLATTHAFPLAAQAEGARTDGRMLTISAAPGFVQVGNVQAKIKRRLTIPLLKLDVDGEDAVSQGRLSQTIFGRVVEGIHEGRAVHNAKYPTPARLMTIEAIDGTQCKIVVNAVMQRELESDDGYPDQTYVGCWFRITKFRRSAGKNYNTFEVIEIEAPAPQSTQARIASDQANAA